MYIENNKIKYITAYKRLRTNSWWLSFHKRGGGERGSKGGDPTCLINPSQFSKLFYYLYLPPLTYQTNHLMHVKGWWENSSHLVIEEWVNDKHARGGWKSHFT